MAEGERGTQITFMPSSATFSNPNFPTPPRSNAAPQAFLNSGVRIVLRDKRPSEPLERVLHYIGGCACSSVSRPDQDSGAASPPIVMAGDRDRLSNVALQWNGYPRGLLVLHQQHSAARRRNPSLPAFARR
ncbi:MAG: hypothetical protein R3C97_16920 [Geminicoccaceae bacterium]